MLRTTPAVFAVGNNYQIMVPVTKPSLFWVEIDGECYYDEENGIMRSLCAVHRVTVPTEVLDRAKQYTVCEREMIDRKPYFPKTAEPVRTNFAFRPIPTDEIRIYHISDAHDHVAEPVAAARKFGEIDLLILNGDIPNHSGEISNFDTIYRLAQELTGGHIPIVFARGNHDMRGYHAEEIASYIPNQNGNTYYSFRLGKIWGLVLDCGEDKDDSHAEYGFTVACHAFRMRQTAYIQELIRRAEAEYGAEGVAHKLIVSHNPFTHQLSAPFNIEKDVYATWARLLREAVCPDLMLCGHLHKTQIWEKGCSEDHLGQPCKLVVGADIDADRHTGCGLILYESKTPEIAFYSSDPTV